MVEKYGNRNVPKMIAEIEALRKAIRAEGTPAIQDAWDRVESHIDYAYRADLSQAAIAAAKRRAEARRQSQQYWALRDRVHDMRGKVAEAVSVARTALRLLQMGAKNKSDWIAQESARLDDLSQGLWE